MTKSFKSVGEFIEHLQAIAPAAVLTQNRGLHAATEMVWNESRHSLGEYQDEAGPFVAWAQLADATLEGWTDKHGHHYPGKVEMGYSPPDNPLMRTGELKAAIEMAVDAHEGVVGVASAPVGNGTPEDPYRDIGDVAVDLELGTRKMPPRSFLGRALYVKQEEVVATIGHAVVLGLIGDPFTAARKADDDLGDIPF